MSLAETLQFQVVAAAGVALLVGLSWALGFRGRARIDSLTPYADEKRVQLTETAIDAEGRAGIGLLADGSVLLARVMGTDVAVRLVSASAIKRVAIREDDVAIGFDDIGFPELKLKIAQPPLWIGRLRP